MFNAEKVLSVGNASWNGNADACLPRWPCDRGRSDRGAVLPDLEPDAAGAVKVGSGSARWDLGQVEHKWTWVTDIVADLEGNCAASGDRSGSNSWACRISITAHVVRVDILDWSSAPFVQRRLDMLIV